MTAKKNIATASAIASTTALGGAGLGYTAGLQDGQSMPARLYLMAPPPGATPEKDNQRFSLAQGSPAIDSGDNAKAKGEWDIRGAPYARTVDGDLDGTATPDRGAFEFQPWQIVIAACPADIDHDGTVGYADLTQVLSAWGPCPAGAAQENDR